MGIEPTAPFRERLKRPTLPTNSSLRSRNFKLTFCACRLAIDAHSVYHEIRINGDHIMRPKLKTLLWSWIVIALILFSALPSAYALLSLAVMITVAPTDLDPAIRIKEERMRRRGLW